MLKLWDFRLRYYSTFLTKVMSNNNIAANSNSKFERHKLFATCCTIPLTSIWVRCLTRFSSRFFPTTSSGRHMFLDLPWPGRLNGNNLDAGRGGEGGLRGVSNPWGQKFFYDRGIRFLYFSDNSKTFIFFGKKIFFFGGSPPPKKNFFFQILYFA